MIPSKEYDFDPRNLPPEFLQAIGLALVSGAQTQNIVEHAIWGCLGLDVEYGMSITTHMPDPLRMNALKAAAEIRIDDPDALDELDSLLESVENALNSRNNYAHQCWATDPETGGVLTVKDSARGSVSMELLPQSINKVESEAIAIYKAGMDLMKFLIKLDLLPPLPPLHRYRWHKTKAARKKRRKQRLG